MKSQEQKEMDDIFGEEGESKTAFNSALDIIQRISRLEYSLTSCFLQSPFEDLSGAYKILILIHTEIDFKLSKEQSDEIEVIEKEIYSKLKQAEARYNNEGRTYSTYPEVREEVLLKLINLKKRISKFKYKVGLGMIDQSDPRYALLNG